MMELLLSFHLSFIYYWNFFELDRLSKSHRYIVHSVFILNNISLIYNIPNEQIIHIQLLLLLLSDVHKYVNEIIYSLTYIISVSMMNYNNIFIVLSSATYIKCFIQNLFLCKKWSEPKLKRILTCQSILLMMCFWLFYWQSRYTVYYFLYRLVKFSNMSNKKVNYEWFSYWNVLDEVLLPRFTVHTFIL
jgi:hypothetical protein